MVSSYGNVTKLGDAISKKSPPKTSVKPVVGVQNSDVKSPKSASLAKGTPQSAKAPTTKSPAKRTSRSRKQVNYAEDD
jgi:hypothetical protein